MYTRHNNCCPVSDHPCVTLVLPPLDSETGWLSGVFIGLKTLYFYLDLILDYLDYLYFFWVGGFVDFAKIRDKA